MFLLCLLRRFRCCRRRGDGLFRGHRRLGRHGGRRFGPGSGTAGRRFRLPRRQAGGKRLDRRGGRLFPRRTEEIVRLRGLQPAAQTAAFQCVPSGIRPLLLPLFPFELSKLAAGVGLDFTVLLGTRVLYGGEHFPLVRLLQIGEGEQRGGSPACDHPFLYSGKGLAHALPFGHDGHGRLQIHRTQLLECLPHRHPVPRRVGRYAVAESQKMHTLFRLSQKTKVIINTGYLTIFPRGRQLHFFALPLSFCRKMRYTGGKCQGKDGISVLQLILGRSGYGKTHRIRQELVALARQEETPPLVLLVPEQYSFESERELLKALGPRLAGRIQVLSFTRLAQTVGREVGGLAGRQLDDGTRALLMSRALEETADALTFYRRQAASPDYVQAMLSLLSECKQCAITPHQLETAAATLEDGTLRQKMGELALVLDAYDALASRSHIDPLDSLTLLAERLPESRRLDGALVFVDSFKGFTAQELQVLRALLCKAAKVTVALCADAVEDTAAGYGLFSPVIRTAARLRSMAYEAGVPVAKVELLRENHRSRCTALRLLEAGAFSPRPAVDSAPTEAAAVIPCADLYEECAFVARRIRRLLREEGRRCRDIAVVARNLAAYEGVLDVAFEEEGVPYYMDRREDILTDPLITLTLSALRAATEPGGPDTEEMLRLLKTGLLPAFDAEHTAALENYLYMWRIRGSMWRRPWSWNPLGLSAKLDDEALSQLAQRNRDREALMEPIERLRAALHGPHKPDGRAFAQAVYHYLTDVQADEAVRLQVARLDEAGEHALADRAARLWDLLMDMLSRYALALGDISLAPARHTELLRLMAASADLGAIPQNLDAVQVGGADRLRFSDPAVVFILGANEGVFPAYPVGGGLLNDAERRQLIAAGLPMTDAGDLQAVEERFFAYAALSAPSERLFVSYQLGNAAGETLVPSSLVEQVRRILPGCAVLQPTDPACRDVESEKDALSRLAPLLAYPTAQAAAIAQWFDSRPAYAPRLDAMRRAAQGAPAAFTDDKLAKRFFGDDMRLSPSRVEKYHYCRFAYFCQYGLKAKARRPADLDAMEFGTLAHYVMEVQLREYTEQKTDLASLPKAQVLADAGRRVMEYADTVLGGTENKSARFAWLLSRLVATCGGLLWQVVRELAQSRFVPVAFELPIGSPNGEPEEAGVEPLVLTLPDGARIRVQGQVDRVDVYQKDGISYVRVVDYKTGHKEFRLDEVVEGINLQMLIYILSICQNGGPHIGEKPPHDLQENSPIQPAGVLYLPARLPVVRVERGAQGEALEKERTRTMRMNGLLLDDPAIVRAMEAEAAGLFIPARIGANGNYLAGSSVASLRQFGLLKKRIEALLCDMAATLRKGDVAAVPACGSVDACAWCDYRAVCGHEAGDPARLIAKQDADAVWQELADAAE